MEESSEEVQEEPQVSSLPDFLIDSNIIAQWVLPKYIFSTVSKLFGLPDEIISPYQNRYSNSIQFIDRVLERSSDDEKFFYTFDFNLLETVKALKDEIRTLQLFNNGVPISKWASRQEHQDVTFDERVKDAIYESYNKAQDALFGDDKIMILSHPLSEKGDDWEDYYSLFSRLMLDMPGLLTQDGMIISACIFYDIEYLITRDSDLKGLKKSLEKTLNESKLELKIIDPGAPLLIKI